MVRITGIFPPVPTPFDEQGELKLDALQSNIQALVAAGVDGVVLLGSNGEYPLLDEEEKKAVIAAGLQALPPGRLGLVGVGAESTRAVIRLAEFAARHGAAAVLVVSPSYYKPMMTREVLRRFYLEVAEASPVPVVLYSVPRFTGYDLPADLVVELAHHPNICGLKDSSGDVVRLQGYVDRCPPGWSVLVGHGSALYPALAVGAAGGVLALANVAPAETVRLYRLFRSGEWEAARRLQAALTPVNEAVTARFGIPGVKAAMDLRGLYGGPPRRPLLPLDPAAREELRGILARAGLL
nr:MAG: dihydrodipicolinate synthase family protein [Bacillota bacterium]